jgi:phasin family protein
MFSNSEQFSQAAKAMIEAQLGALTTFTQTTYEAGANVVDLNMSALKASLAARTVASTQMLAAKDPKEFLELAATQSQQSFERALAYSREAASLASGNQAKFSSAAETGIAETKRNVSNLVDAARKAPGGAA